MSDCRAHVLLLDEVFFLLRSGALGLGSGIASFDVDENKLHIVTNDGRELYFEFSVPPDGNKVVNMFLSRKKDKLIIQQKQGNAVHEYSVWLPELHGIEDVIDAKCTVGGVPVGRHYDKGFSLEEIVRQILSGHPHSPNIKLTSKNDRYNEEEQEIYLDITVPEALTEEEIFNMFTSIPETDPDMEIEDVFISVPTDIEIHETVSDPKGEKYQEILDLAGKTLSNYYNEREYQVKAYAVDTMGHVGQDLITVKWVYPAYIGIYNGKYLIDVLENHKYMTEDAIAHPSKYNDNPAARFIPLEELNEEQRMDCLDIEHIYDDLHDKIGNLLKIQYYDNDYYEPVSDPRNDPEKFPDYAQPPYYDPESEDFNPDYDKTNERTYELMHHIINDSNDLVYDVPENTRGRVIICYPIKYGKLGSILHNDEVLLNKYHYGYYKVHWTIGDIDEEVEYLIYVSDDVYNFKEGDQIITEGRSE